MNRMGKDYQRFTDQQGNILSVVDENGGRVFDATYDAWGRQTVTLNTICLHRGYTGHEMMGEFGLINMNRRSLARSGESNGRVYDPTLGRFLSPDNYVQAPGNSQSFNRYSYCLNNPLKYTDPSGELFGIDDLGIALAFAGLSAANSMIGAAYSGKSVWKAGAFSLLSSAARYGVGAVFGQTGSFGNELLRAGAHGLADATLSALSGGDFFSSFVSSASSSGIGSYAQAARMGTGLMGASSSAMGGMVAWVTGGDFLQGALKGLQIGLLNHAMHDGGFGIRYYHDKNGNQCGDISEVVVTPDKSWVVPVAETTNTILDNIGSSLKKHGGNSTWGSNGHFYWHGSGKQGFYGNQYVTATKLSVIGVKIAKYTGPTGKTLDFIQLTNGIYSDYEAYGQYGYTNGYNSIMATARIVGGSVGSIKLMGVAASAGSTFGPAGTVIGGIVGGIIGAWGGSKLCEIGVNMLYSR